MPITTDEAVRRAEAIVPLLADDIRMAIEIAETMEAGNRILPPGLKGREVKYAGAYDTIHHALSLKLAIDIARIFDLSEGRDLDTQDKASIPVLIHHLKKPEVKADLISKSHHWDALPTKITLSPPEACEGAIKLTIDKASILETDEAVEALNRVRQLRTRRLAHMLFDKEPDPLPRYSDMFLLLKLAREITTPAVLAVEGRLTLFDGNEKLAKRDAERFWDQVLKGILLDLD